MRDDHRVVVAAGDPRHRLLAVAGGEVVLARDKDIGLGIEHEECRAPLLHEMIGHDYHGLCGKSQAAHLHRGCGDFPGFPGTNAMRKQRRVALQHPPHSIFLVPVEVAIAQHRAVHAGKSQVRAVEGAKADIVERIVVEARKPVSALFVLPNPLAEFLLQLLLLLARRKCLLRVDDAGVLVDLVVDGGRAPVKRVLDEIRRRHPVRAVGGGVGHRVLCVKLDAQGPGGDRAAMRYRHGALRNAQELADKVADIACWNPRGAKPGADVAGLQVGRLYAFERLDVAGIRRIKRSGRFRRPELLAHIAA